MLWQCWLAELDVCVATLWIILSCWFSETSVYHKYGRWITHVDGKPSEGWYHMLTHGARDWPRGAMAPSSDLFSFSMSQLVFQSSHFSLKQTLPCFCVLFYSVFLRSDQCTVPVGALPFLSPRSPVLVDTTFKAWLKEHTDPPHFCCCRYHVHGTRT